MADRVRSRDIYGGKGKIPGGWGKVLGGQSKIPGRHFSDLTLSAIFSWRVE